MTDQCATNGCERPAAWISITEGNRLGSRAPRRCRQCCDAIAEANHGNGTKHKHAVTDPPSCAACIADSAP